MFTGISIINKLRRENELAIRVASGKVEAACIVSKNKKANGEHAVGRDISTRRVEGSINWQALLPQEIWLDIVQCGDLAMLLAMRATSKCLQEVVDGMYQKLEGFNNIYPSTQFERLMSKMLYHRMININSQLSLSSDSLDDSLNLIEKNNQEIDVMFKKIDEWILNNINGMVMFYIVALLVIVYFLLVADMPPELRARFIDSM